MFVYISSQNQQLRTAFMSGSWYDGKNEFIVNVNAFLFSEPVVENCPYESKSKCPFLSHAKEARPEVQDDVINLTAAANVSLNGKSLK